MAKHNRETFEDQLIREGVLVPARKFGQNIAAFGQLAQLEAEEKKAAKRKRRKKTVK